MWQYGSLKVTMLREVIEDTMTTTAMVMLVVLAAIFLNFVRPRQSWQDY